MRHEKHREKIVRCLRLGKHANSAGAKHVPNGKVCRLGSPNDGDDGGGELDDVIEDYEAVRDLNSGKAGEGRVGWLGETGWCC